MNPLPFQHLQLKLFSFTVDQSIDLVPGADIKDGKKTLLATIFIPLEVKNIGLQKFIEVLSLR